MQWSVLIPVVLTLVATQEQQSVFVKFLGNLCYPKWAMEAFIIANAERFVVVFSLFFPFALPIKIIYGHSHSTTRIMQPEGHKRKRTDTLM